MRNQFSSVLEYFGEDPGMSSVDFFATLDKFVKVNTIQFNTAESQPDIVKYCSSLARPSWQHEKLLNGFAKLKRRRHQKRR